MGMRVSALITICHRFRAQLSVLVLGVAVGLAIMMGFAQAGPQVRIVHINVGQADATLIVGPSRTLLFDSGGAGAGSRIRAVLDSLGITSLDYFVAGHYHSDHIGGIDELINGGIRINIAVYDRGGTYDPTQQYYTDYINAVGALRTTIALNQEIDLGRGCTLKCIAVNGVTNHGTFPPTGENDRSIALVLRFGTFDYLIGSDMTGGAVPSQGSATTNVESLCAPDAGDVDVLRVDHHGGGDATNPMLVDILQPEHAIISLSYNNSSGFPAQEVLDRLTAAPTMNTIWQTQSGNGGTSPIVRVGGNITFLTDGTYYSISISSTGETFTYMTDGISGVALGLAPFAPSNLTATVASSSQINLAWTDNSINESGIAIERSTNGTSFSIIAVVAANVTSYANTNLTASKTYYYRVRAYNASGNSTYSNTAQAVTLAVPPAAPSNLAATPFSSSQINLAWTDNGGNEDGFKVERSTDGTSFAQIATVGANVTTYSNTGLTASTAYYYRVRSYNSSGDSAYSNTASATTGGPLPAPSSLTATPFSSSQINLAWTDNDANEDGVKIERSPDGTGFAQIATVGVNATTYSDTGLTALTVYYYRVRSYNSSTDSAYSNTASATTPGPPAAPSNLTATPVSSSQINLAWTDNAGNESGFKVERSPDGTSFTQIATVGANVTMYSNTGLTALTVYYYRVRSYNSSADSAYSNTASATTPGTPAAPSNLTATPFSSSQINLAWTDNATNEDGFKIERSSDGTSFSLIATVAANVTTYSNTGRSPATTYYYRVRAYNTTGNSAYSNTASATTPPLPAAPSNLTATAVSSSQINLAWTDNATDEAGFKIYRSSDGTTFSQIVTVAANVTIYSDTGRSPATTYYYKVLAYNTNGSSLYSNIASATTLTPPAAPSNLTATAVSSSQINLAWTDNSADEDGFKIYRSTDGITFSLIATLGSNVTTYSNTGRSPATTYYYKVLAYNTGGNSAYSNTASATTPPLPAAPNNLTATAVSSSQINLAWTDNATDEDGFKIERSTDGTTFSQIATVAANVTGYSNTGRSPSTTYYYRVRAYNTNGNSSYSNTASATTSP